MKITGESFYARRIFPTMCVMALFALPSLAFAQEKGGERLVKLSRIETTTDAAAVAPGDTIVMSCPKCKDTWVTVVQTTFKATNPQEQRQVKQHQCPGCGSERVTTGHGKSKVTTYVHVCRACGSEDVNCCVMKKGTGPTKGME